MFQIGLFSCVEYSFVTEDLRMDTAVTAVLMNRADGRVDAKPRLESIENEHKVVVD